MTQSPVSTDESRDSTSCTACGKDWRGSGFVCLSGSAFDEEDEDGGAVQAIETRCYLHLERHGPGSEPGHPYASEVLVDGAEDGGFDLYFCSAACLRSWFSAAIDRLEEQYRRSEA